MKPGQQSPGIFEGKAPPPYWRGQVESVLIDAAAIQRRVGELAGEIARDYRDKELVIVALLNGTVVFLGDLIRLLELPLRLDFIGISSYGKGVAPGKLHFTKELRLDVKGRDVLIVDDILDTGQTLKTVTGVVEQLGPRSLKSCVLLDKKERRKEAVEADYAGFVIPDEFVVGYGLDFAERFRNLPFIGVLKKEIYNQAG